MQSDLIDYLEKQREYLANRAVFPVDELAKFAGQWIAWSHDGAQILAHATDPLVLDDLIRALGKDPEKCLIEGIPLEDSVIGRVECA